MALKKYDSELKFKYFSEHKINNLNEDKCIWITNFTSFKYKISLLPFTSNNVTVRGIYLSC